MREGDQPATRAPAQGALNRPLAQAATLFNTLSAHGLRYQVDPNTPFSRISAEQVDYVQFPRETLRLKSGDCDDLSVLLAAAYENLGIETALIDVPGHLFLMFRTGLKEADRGLISLQEDLLVDSRRRDLDTGLEATLDRDLFHRGLGRGRAQVPRRRCRRSSSSVLSLRQAWEKHPARDAWRPQRAGVEVPTGERVDSPDRARATPAASRGGWSARSSPIAGMLAANPKDDDARLQIGMIYGRNGVSDVAHARVRGDPSAGPAARAARNNRGNLYYARGDYERALEAYRIAEELEPGDGGIRVNAALAYYRLGKLPEARTKYREATQLKKELATQYGAFAKLLGN